MGFFKNIGKKIKSFAKKNLNIKTLVKVGGMIDPSGLVGGLQAAHYEKKAGRVAEAAMMAEQAGANAVAYANDKGIFGSTLTGAVNQAGATVIDGSMTTWLKQNWGKVLGALAVLGAVIYLATRGGRSRGYGRR